MRGKVLIVCAAGLLSVPAAGRPAAPPPRTPRADLAALIRRAVVAKMPREFEDLSEWGKTIPMPVGVRFPRLKRTAVKVGDHYELPHGPWKRTKVFIDDPDRDLRLEVPEARALGKGVTRLRVEATVALRALRERQQWVKGVLLADVTADADAVVAVGLDVDVKVAFDVARPLDGLKVEAKVAKVRLDLKAFKLRRVGPVVLQEESPLGDELKARIQERLETLEPRIKERANRAIAQGIKENRGLLPAVGGKADPPLPAVPVVPAVPGGTR